METQGQNSEMWVEHHPLLVREWLEIQRQWTWAWREVLLAGWCPCCRLGLTWRGYP